MEEKVLTRAKHGFLTGTLAGFADYYNLSVSGLKLVFIILTLCGGMGIIFYLVLRLSIPAYTERPRLLAEKAAKN